MIEPLVLSGVVATAVAAAAVSSAMPDWRSAASDLHIPASHVAKRWLMGRLGAAPWRRTQPPDLAAQIAAAAESMQASVTAGASLMQAIARAGGETPPPVGTSLAAAATRIEMGADTDVSLDAVLREIETTDMRLLVGALRMHRRVGGPLAPVLGALAEVLRERAGLRREMDTATAQARLSARVVTVLPYGFLAFLALTSGGAVLGEIASPVGAVCLGVGAGLQRIATLWIRRIASPEQE